MRRVDRLLLKIQEAQRLDEMQLARFRVVE